MLTQVLFGDPLAFTDLPYANRLRLINNLPSCPSSCEAGARKRDSEGRQPHTHSGEPTIPGPGPALRPLSSSASIKSALSPPGCAKQEPVRCHDRRLICLISLSVRSPTDHTLCNSRCCARLLVNAKPFEAQTKGHGGQTVRIKI